MDIITRITPPAWIVAVLAFVLVCLHVRQFIRTRQTTFISRALPILYFASLYSFVTSFSVDIAIRTALVRYGLAFWFLSEIIDYVIRDLTLFRKGWAVMPKWLRGLRSRVFGGK